MSFEMFFKFIFKVLYEKSFGSVQNFQKNICNRISWNYICTNKENQFKVIGWSRKGFILSDIFLFKER